jgi:hypothetical protein
MIYIYYLFSFREYSKYVVIIIVCYARKVHFSFDIYLSMYYSDIK